MKIRKYLVNDMNEAMVRIRYELGNDAIIVSKRFVRQKGIFKYFKKKMIEVTAAVDEGEENIKPEDVKKVNDIDVKKDIINNQMNNANKEKTNTDDKNLIKEMKELKKIVSELKGGEKETEEITKVEYKRYPIEDILDDYDLDRNVREKFFNYLTESNIDFNDANKLNLYKFLKDNLTEFLNTDIENEERIQIFIGPTGVGKTTTIAKLAANETLTKKKNVALITIDTYRIGAVEQLKTYANILDTPLEVVVTKDELINAIDKFKDYDKILIDSTGRSHRDKDKLNEVNDYFTSIDEKNTYLVLSITTNKKDLSSIIENYKKIGYNNIILTKLDESENHGNILNISSYTDKPISYICTGQNVPDDIEIANKQNLFKYIWGDVEDGSSSET
ncbi:MAG: flagellar biosynthesis protein FlhF [Firmicutes bacterium]|nr:flagellar biosynthesis protein FlhF [Bacillota bacterium]